MINASIQDKGLIYLSTLCVGSVMGLLTIWVLPNTIAFRHVLIGLGLISSIAIIYKSNFFKGRTFLELLPLSLLALLFIWALIHFAFFSLNPDLELQELSSIWLRAFAGAVVAIGLSIGLGINPRLKPYFFVSLFVVSWINLGAYLYLSLRQGSFILPVDFVWAFVFKKIEAAFFGVISISISCANLVYLFAKKIDQKNATYIFLWFIGISTAVVSSLVANTKNGVAVALGLCFLLALTILSKALFQKQHSKLGVLVVSLFICLLAIGAWHAHSKFAQQGWSTLLEDAIISSQIDQHNYWRLENAEWEKLSSEPFPTNSSGARVAGNTYQRVAWATKGIELINQYPLGYGSINRSFVGLLNYTKAQQNLLSQTHSGWVDFGLAFGVPGLTILLCLFIVILYRGLLSQSQFGLMGSWLILGIVPFGFVAEICYKHNFEILIFFISFSVASSMIDRRVIHQNEFPIIQ